MDNETNEASEVQTEDKKPELTVFDVNLHEDYDGERVYTDKRFPNGRIRIYLPAPILEVPEEINKFFQDTYNKDVQALLNAGIVQNAYGERDWDNLKSGSKKISECSDEEILANIQRDPGQGGLGPIDGEDFEDKAREFFEVAVFTEKKERTSDATKVVAKKLKNAGVNTISDEEIAMILAKRAEEAEEVVQADVKE
jgi:hypothetical protein